MNLFANPLSRMKLSLRKQCLCLVLLILAGELLFASALFLQLKQAQAELARESRLKEIFQRSQNLVNMLNDYQQDLETWFKARDEKSDLSIAQKEKQMAGDSSFLMENTRVYPELYARVEKLRGTQNKLFRVVGLARGIVEKLKDDRMQMVAFVQRFVSKGESLRREWEHDSVNLLENEQLLLDAYPKLQSNRRSQIRAVLCFGLAGNVFIVLAFAIFFFRGISRRLAIMTENTKRIAAKQELLARLEDYDEIGRLDHEFHALQQSINSAQMERQAFLAMVSHELRTPLMSVNTTFELLSSGILGDLSLVGRGKANACDRKLSALINLINDLLDLEKLEAGKITLAKRTVYLESVIEKAIEQNQELAEQKCICLQSAECDSEVLADPDRLAQAIANIVCNAVQAAVSGSLVEIEATEINGVVELRVMDRGPGIDKTLGETIFERFRFLPGSEQIVMKGMGLPIAKRLIELHEGKIWFSDREGGGTVFTVSLPLLLTP